MMLGAAVLLGSVFIQYICSQRGVSTTNNKDFQLLTTGKVKSATVEYQRLKHC